MIDPHAPGGTFTHWLVYGIPPSICGLARLPAGAAEGVNDFGRRGYGGPCPPRGPATGHTAPPLAAPQAYAGTPAQLVLI